MCPPAVPEVAPDAGAACVQVCANAARGSVGDVDREVAVSTAGGNLSYRGRGGLAIDGLELEQCRDGDVVGFRAVFESELAGGVVAEGEDAASIIEYKGVVVADCDLRDGEALEDG